MTTPKITLTKIAQQAGVSITSVSRVIHTPHLTSRETQEKVNQAITILGFNASLFKPHNQDHVSRKILIIDNQLFTSSFINQGIEHKAQELGYKLLYLRFLYFSEHEIQQIISYTINYKVDGILIINNSPYLASLPRYQRALPPIVLVNQFSLIFPCVYFDHLSIAFRATKYLIEQGHKRIAVLLGDKDKDEVNFIMQGYQQALIRANMPITPQYMAYHCFNYSTSHNTIKKLMQLPLPPTAVICSDYCNLNYLDRDKLIKDERFDKAISAESSICGVIDQCGAMNIDIPADLSLLQFTHHKGYKQYRPLNHICAIYKPLFEMGDRAVDLLVSQMQTVHKIRSSLLIDAELITRHSTATIMSSR